jgi:peptide/nickel transport system ATP-binding protein
MTEFAVRLSNVRKVFGTGAKSVTAVSDLSFDLEAGSSLAIVGESGSGKTTAARCLVGLETPTSGEIWVNGRQRGPDRPSAAERRRRAHDIQMVFQDPYGSLNPRMSALAVLDHALAQAQAGRSHREERIARAYDLMALVDFPRGLADSRPRRLSGGQRQRLAIARALASDPDVLVLDEAVAALDVSVQAQVLNLFNAVQRSRGLSLIFISHDLAAVRQIADQILVMREGKVVEAGASEAVLDNPQNDYTKRLLDSVPRRGWTPAKASNVSDERTTA